MWDGRPPPITGLAVGPTRHTSLAEQTSSPSRLSSRSPGPSSAGSRSREPLFAFGSGMSVPSTAAACSGRTTSAASSTAASPLASSWRGELETMQAQLNTAMKDAERIKEMNEAKVSQTETALVEVCKSLGLQQQQLEHQEMCTGMIHQLLQDCLPNLRNYAQRSPETTEVIAGVGAGVSSNKVEIETLCKEVCGKIETTLLQEHQLGLAGLASTLREELEVVRSEAVSVVMRCWRELQQNSDERVNSDARAAVGAELEAQISEVRGDLDSIRTELLGALRESISDDVARQLSAFRDEMRRECGIERRRDHGEIHPNSELYLKHKELSYLVHAQQSLLSQHAEELESFRHEQHANLVTVATAVGNKLDMVSELCRVLHHKVESILPEVRTNGMPQADSLRSFQMELDNVSGVASSLQKDFDTACSQLSTNCTSAWPMLQRKLVELTDSVNDVSTSSTHLNSQTVAVEVGVTLGGLYPSKPLEKQPMDTLMTDPIKVHAWEGGKARAFLQHQSDTANSSVASSWKDLQEDLRSAAEVLYDVCAEPSPLEASRTCASQPRMLKAAQVDGSQADWWRELQEKHPDLARLVNSQRAELTRIVGSCSDKQFPASRQPLSASHLASVLSPSDSHVLYRS